MDSDSISESVQVFQERGYFACGPSWPDTFDYTSMQSTHICIVVVTLSGRNIHTKGDRGCNLLTRIHCIRKELGVFEPHGPS